MRRVVTGLLLALAATPAIAQSKNSDQVADLIQKWLVSKGLGD